MNLLHAWLVYDRQGAKRNASYIEMHKTIGHSMGIEFELKLTDSIPDDLSLTPKPDFALIRTICPELSRQLESNKIPIFNNSHIAAICNDIGNVYRTSKIAIRNFGGVGVAYL